MSCFSVTEPFLTTFYYVEKRNGILRKNRGEGFEKSYVPLHGEGGGVKHCQNQPYVISKWPLRLYFTSSRNETSQENCWKDQKIENKE